VQNVGHIHLNKDKTNTINAKCLKDNFAKQREIFDFKIELTEISVAFMQQENGTPQLSTLGEVQLKYSFFCQSMKPVWLSPQHWN